ncbi:AraC family transcriptional regulator [Chryseobacterium indologenes]|uniref:AraC family transcriptional regulator n=1 Tax=Chryseobacterium indologenes TaxID=253 RepID=UPI000B51B68D|nr:AraC family transcriptional regulator [Chryseobacterium indologenes]ASE62026.1 AraC family transcriptional regulator [Chryseobacterium indologenes]
MNTYLLSKVEGSVREAVEEFTILPWIDSALQIYEIDLFEVQLNRLIDYYVLFFQKIGFLPKEMQLFRSSYILKKRIKEFNSSSSNDFITGFINVIEAMSNDYSSRIIPINLHYSKKNDFSLITGIAVTDPCGKNITFLLHEFAIPRILININPRDLIYIQRCLEEYNTKFQKSLEGFVASLNKNYKQFQKDCKIYLEDTFYQFFMKLKMIRANHDILFTNMTLKEVAYNNQFSDYLNLYRLFTQRYQISLDEIPRFCQMF